MTISPRTRLLSLLLLLLIAPAAFAQSNDDASRKKTRERMNALLERIGTDVKIEFRPSQNSQFRFVGMLKEGLVNADSMEIVITVTESETISIRAYPHYKGGYINIDKARSSTQLMRKLIQYNDTTFLFWGADESGDVFTGYTFTLESGFPDEAIRVVLSSIKNSDKFVGEMRTFI